MKLSKPLAVQIAKELTLSALENNLIVATQSEPTEEKAKKVLDFFNVIADGLKEN
jgi:hypothetical protein